MDGIRFTTKKGLLQRFCKIPYDFLEFSRIFTPQLYNIFYIFQYFSYASVKGTVIPSCFNHPAYDSFCRTKDGTWCDFASVEEKVNCGLTCNMCDDDGYRSAINFRNGTDCSLQEEAAMQCYHFCKVNNDVAECGCKEGYLPAELQKMLF